MFMLGDANLICNSHSSISGGVLGTSLSCYSCGQLNEDFSKIEGEASPKDFHVTSHFSNVTKHLDDKDTFGNLDNVMWA